jgi:dTMP kinase
MDSAPASPRRLPGQGVLVVFEGIDGAGKSTQVRRLVDDLSAEGWDVVMDREPTDGPHGRRLRESAVTGRLSAAEELDLFMADRRQHVAEVIQPALDSGRVVVLDRYYHSNAAYQGSRGLDWREIVRRNEAFAPRPDLVLWIDVDPAVSGARIRARGDVANQFERIDQLQRCREIFAGLGDERIQRIDGAQTESEVEGDVREAVQALLSTRTR